MSRLRRGRGPAVVLAVAVLLAVAVYVWVRSFDPRPWVAFLLAAGPLVCPGLPSALMLQATIRHGDPYRVRGSVSPHE